MVVRHWKLRTLYSDSPPPPSPPPLSFIPSSFSLAHLSERPQPQTLAYLHSHSVLLCAVEMVLFSLSDAPKVLQSARLVPLACSSNACHKDKKKERTNARDMEREKAEDSPAASGSSNPQQSIISILRRFSTPLFSSATARIHLHHGFRRHLRLHSWLKTSEYSAQRIQNENQLP